MPRKKKTKLPETFTTNTVTTACPPRKLHCLDCGHEHTVTDLTKHRCPQCYEHMLDRFVPYMVDVPPPSPVPVEQPKVKLPGKLRYAKVHFEPINKRMREITFEDDHTKGRLWVHVSTPTLRHVQLIVKPNPDEAQGGWVIERELARIMA